MKKTTAAKKTAKAKPEAELPKGFTCHCGEYHRFSGYVYAHWTTSLNFTCHKCSRDYSCIGGVVTPL